MKATSILFCLFVLLAVLSTANTQRLTRKAQEIKPAKVDEVVEAAKVDEVANADEPEYCSCGGFVENYPPPPTCQTNCCFYYECTGYIEVPGLEGEDSGYCYLVQKCIW